MNDGSDSDAGTTMGAADTGPDPTSTTGDPPGNSTTTGGTPSGTTTGDVTTGPVDTTGVASEASSGGVGDDSSGGTTGTTGGEAGLGFDADVWPLFAPNCGCHLDNDGAGKLLLAKDVAYENLVGRPSNQVKGMMLVEPGSAENSYLWHKLSGTQKSVGGEGKKMPPGGLLEQAEIDLVAQWIDQGAAP